MINAGVWKIKVSGPHPCWCEIVYEGGPEQEIRGIHHKELRDLQYAIERAILDVRDRLSPRYKHEID